jgi:cob(I)alamin adenosyltransferase
VKIYTRRGDTGQTDLFGGERVGKDALRVSAYGDVDELNASIGVALAAGIDASLADSMARIQSALFDLGASLATPDPAHRRKAGVVGVADSDIDALEMLIDRLEAGLEPLATFILPGGTPAAAAFHVARTVCRRAERLAVALAREEEIGPSVIPYLNRLSDALFVMARWENRHRGVEDVTWNSRL